MTVNDMKITYMKSLSRMYHPFLPCKGDALAAHHIDENCPVLLLSVTPVQGRCAAAHH